MMDAIQDHATGLVNKGSGHSTISSISDSSLQYSQVFPTLPTHHHKFLTSSSSFTLYPSTPEIPSISDLPSSKYYIKSNEGDWDTCSIWADIPRGEAEWYISPYTTCVSITRVLFVIYTTSIRYRLIYHLQFGGISGLQWYKIEKHLNSLSILDSVDSINYQLIWFRNF